MEKKEIGMRKLMKYVEEMQKEGINICRPQVQEYYILRMILISKHYGLIKWLVENDKINTQNLITYMNGTSLTFNKVPSTDCASIDKTWNNFYTECLLMLLSIQDNPIEFLISILK